jgi:hypothetical protein
MPIATKAVPAEIDDLLREYDQFAKKAKFSDFSGSAQDVVAHLKIRLASTIGQGRAVRIAS